MSISILTKNQKRAYTHFYTENGTQYKLTCVLRYDDECGNGHNTFSITGEQYRKAGNGRWCKDSFGCLHEDIAKHFPEYAHLIKWHLTSSDGPMYYLANTIYHASSKDCWGKRKGDPASFDTVLYFGDFPIHVEQDQKFLAWLEEQQTYDFTIAKIEHPKHGNPNEYQYGPKWTFIEYGAEKWHQCPFRTEQEAQEFLAALQHYPPRFYKYVTSFSNGKEPDLNAARSCAVWPEATDEDLQEEGLKERLVARLPALLSEFQAEMEQLGFTY